jgi:hypothetical protein
LAFDVVAAGATTFSFSVHLRYAGQLGLSVLDAGVFNAVPS